MNQIASHSFRRIARRALRRLLPWVIVLIWLSLISTCSPRQTLLDEIRQLGVLRVATVNNPTSYYIGPGGDPEGFDYDLVKGLADELGVALDIHVALNAPGAVALVRSGAVHIAATGVGVTATRSTALQFTKPLLTAVPQLVYRRGQHKPRDLGDLDGQLWVVRDSTYAERLKQARDKDFPDLKWSESADVEPEELLYQVANGDIDYTIASSELVAINRRYYPNLRVAFPVAKAQPLAWALPIDRDRSLLQATQAYLDRMARTELPRLRDRYFGHVEKVDTLGAMTLATHVQSRLPRFRPMFEKAGQATGLDWRLLAAMGYQESHWNPDAVSPTGVRGIMMLTNATAKLLKIRDREDPAQSIMGGARYYRMLLDELPESIEEPDRTWIALAAYNIGYGHILDVRDLTRQQGANRDRWLDIRKRLPLLTQSHWYSRTRYGYARGHEAVTYVGNIRTYYDMLIWLTGSPPKPPEDRPAEAEESPELPKNRDPLNIILPAM